MDVREHAQLIYAHLLQGWAAAGKPLPPTGDKGMVQLAWMYAKQFHESETGK